MCLCFPQVQWVPLVFLLLCCFGVFLTLCYVCMYVDVVYCTQFLQMQQSTTRVELHFPKPLSMMWLSPSILFDHIVSTSDHTGLEGVRDRPKNHTTDLIGRAIQARFSLISLHCYLSKSKLSNRNSIATVSCSHLRCGNPSTSPENRLLLDPWADGYQLLGQCTDRTTSWAESVNL